MLDDIVPNSTQKRTDFLKAIKDANYVSPGVQGVRFRWHKRIFGKYVGKALDINPNKRWTASKLLEAFRELE